MVANSGIFRYACPAEGRRAKPTDPLNNYPGTLAKITRPQGNRSMSRPRLFARLDALRGMPVIWITGSPGSGKTTLASSYLGERGLRHLWLQLDADDADVANVFYYLGLALRQATGRANASLPALTPEFRPGLARFTRRCAEILAAAIGPPAVLVLDNVEQLPADADLHGVIRELAAALPAGWNLLVLSRTEPPAAYARLRLNEQLAVLDGAELNLTAEEGRELVSVREGKVAGGGHAAPLSSTTRRVDRLLQQTNGWFAGFTLLLGEEGAAELPSASGKTQQLLFDYFASELFERFEPEVQKALLCTSPLPTMTAAEAQRMSGDAGIGAVLAGLHRRNCFVVQRGLGEPVYEYQALFRAFLLDRAAAAFGPEAWRALQQRAGDLLAASGQAEAAASLFRAAGDWESLAALALRQAPSLVTVGRHQTLMHWLADLPADLFNRQPWLHYWRAMACMPFDPIAARAELDRGYAGFQRDGDATGLYSTWAGAMESFFFEFDFHSADGWIAEWERLRERHPEFPTTTVEMRTYWAMGTLLHRQPQHSLLPAWAERAMILLDPDNRQLSVLVGGYLVIWFLWRGEILKARGVIDRIAPWIGADMSPLVSILWSCAVALHHSVHGDLAACRTAVDEALALARLSGLQGFDFLLSAQLARGCLVAGEPAQAEAAIAAMGATMRDHSHVKGAFYGHLLGNASAQRGHWPQAVGHAREGLAMALNSGVPFVEAHCRIDLARALLGQCVDQRTDPSVGERGRESAAQIHAARRIGHTIHSRVIELLCLEAEASAAFAKGDEAHGLARLAEALALGRALGGAIWQMDGAPATARLYERALVAGIETAYVREQIRRRGLVPADPAATADAWPWPIRLHTLGRFEILFDDAPLRSTGKTQLKPLQLLKCLCAFGGQPVGQHRVTDLLWPDSEGDAADQALRTTLHRLRKLLRHEGAVRLEDRQLYLDRNIVWGDFMAFDAAELPALAGAGAETAALQRMLALYRGPFLPGEDAGWAEPLRERLRSRHARLEERLAARVNATALAGEPHSSEGNGAASVPDR